MIEPTEYWENRMLVSQYPRVIVTIKMHRWGPVYRVSGSHYDNLWYLNRDKAVAEFDRRTEELEIA